MHALNYSKLIVLKVKGSYSSNIISLNLKILIATNRPSHADAISLSQDWTSCMLFRQFTFKQCVLLHIIILHIKGCLWLSNGAFTAWC